MPRRSMILALPLVLGIAACQTTTAAAPDTMQGVETSVAASDTRTQAEDARLTAFLDQAYEARLQLSPQGLTAEGRKERYGELDDVSDAAAERQIALLRTQVAALRRDFRADRLGGQARLSYRLFEDSLARAEENYRWRGNRLAVTTNGSPLGNIPVFMINNHRVDTIEDARAYVSRLTQVERQLGQVADRVEAQAAAGVIPARFNFAPVITNGRRAITGAPFGAGPDSPLWRDIQAKVAKLDAPATAKQAVLADARAAMIGPVKRGYDRLVATMQALEPRAPAEGGATRLPDGTAFYASALRNSTTTDMTAEQIHQIGLSEVRRIQGEMQAIQRRVGDTRTLPQLFDYIRTDARFKYPDGDAGRAQYLADATATIDQVMGIAPRWFSVLPRAKLEVRAVEAFRQETASTAFYNAPAPDGSRPGIYYVNLADMKQVIKPQMAGISLHEGAPGHHFQIARAQELQGLPKFRTRGGYGAYSEGWGLYSEALGKEMGFYTDPYDDIGRLSLELWRAVRLVVDTGIHAKGWSRQQAIDYFLANCLVSRIDATREIERYINNPGQATSYKIGQLKIVELRRRAERTLGDRFDIRGFHEAVLANGGVPLDVLEENVDAWIARTRG